MKLLLSLLLAGALYYTNSQATTPIPGSAEDPRGLSGPLQVAIWRKSDGVSSTSHLTNTAPSFPIYGGPVTPGSFFSQALEDERDSQGIATPGAGDFDVEVARYRAVQEATPASPSMIFTVDSAIKNVYTGYPIQQGEVYRISVSSPSSIWSDAEISTTALGYSAKYSPMQKCWVMDGGENDDSAACLRRINNQKPRAPGARWMELVCGVWEVYRKFSEVKDGGSRHFKNSSRKEGLFAVGLALEFTAHSSGELVCFANDAEGLYFDNQGSIDALVERVYWPPAENFNPDYEPFFYLAST